MAIFRELNKIEKESNEQYMRELEASEYRYENLISAEIYIGDVWWIIEECPKKGKRVTFVNSKTRETEWMV